MDIYPLFIVLIYFFIPLALLWFRVIERKFYPYVLGAMVFFALLLLLFEGVSLHDLGIQSDHFYESVLVYGIFALGGIIVVIAFARITMVEMIAPTNWYLEPHLQYRFLILGFAQAFLFLTFFLEKITHIFEPLWIAIFINAVLFTLMYLMFTDFIEVWPLLFVFGLTSSFVYVLYPNLILAGLAHTVINFMFVLHGFATKIKH